MNNKLLKKMRKIQIYMLEELHKICIENNLKYTVICGSMLGTIRHKGFIPWDDDFDIALPRKDYEKLLEILKNKPIKDCYLLDFRTDKHYHLPYAKLCKNNTSYIETYCKNSLSKNGIFIDIFPLDKIKSPTSKIAELRRLICSFITFIIWEKENCKMKRKGIKKLINIIAKIFEFIPKKILINTQKSLAIRENKNWEYLGIIYLINYKTKKLYFKINELDSIDILDFESTKVCCLKNYDEILKRSYNDYMKLPKKECRNSGHDIYKIII